MSRASALTFVPAALRLPLRPATPLGSLRQATTPKFTFSPRRTWRATASPPDPYTSTSTTSDATGASTGANDVPAIDTDAIVSRAKQVAEDVSARPLYYSKIAGYGVGALVLLTVLRAVVSAIDSLPVLPAGLELIGLGYTAWFIWRYVLFRDSRAELLEEIDDFLGRARPGSKD